MKKISVIILVAVLGAMFCACTESKLERDLHKVISEMRVNAYEGENENIKIHVITGKREHPYDIDGKAMPLEEFCVITFTPTGDTDGHYAYELSAGDKEFAGTLDPHPFGDKFIADAGALITANSITVTIANSDGREETLVMAGKHTDEMIDYKQAIREFAAAARTQIGEMYDGKSIAAELYVRFVADPVNDSGQYYWYVALTDGSKTLAVLIDIYSGEIMAERL